MQAPGIYNANGIWQIGPMIIKWGTDEQKQRWLPGILDGRRALVPGLQRARGRLRPRQPAHHRDPRRRRVRRQRPEDLDLDRAPRRSGACSSCAPTPTRSSAARSTRASPRSSSTWTRRASSAARSATSPATTMFNEVLFTDARIPADCRLGDEGEGWQVAMGTLGHERVGTAGLAITMAADLRAMIAAATATNPDALDDPEIRERIARALTPRSSSPSCSTTGRSRRCSRARRTGPRCRSPSCSGATSRRRSPSSPSTCSARRGCSPRAGPTPSTAATWTRIYSWQRYTSIGAGATEVQKNIIADRALLPRK